LGRHDEDYVGLDEEGEEAKKPEELPLAKQLQIEAGS